MDKAIRFQWTTPLSSQKRAICVCSAVRVELVALPISLTSLKSLVYWSLAKSGGPAGRNCEGEAIANGVTQAIWGNTAARKSGGVGRHCPGAGDEGRGMGHGGLKGGFKPSVLRHARMALATSSPHSMPRAMDSLSSSSPPSVIEASDADRSRSNVAFCDGKRFTRAT